MRTGNNGRFLGYLDGTAQAEEVKYRQAKLVGVWEAHSKVGPALKPLLRADEFRFENVVEDFKKKFDQTRDLTLKKGEVYRIADPALVATGKDFERALEYRSSELREHWDKTDRVKQLYRLLSKEFHDDFCKIAYELFMASTRKEVSFRKLGLKNGEIYSSPEDAPRIAAMYVISRVLQRADGRAFPIFSCRV